MGGREGWREQQRERHLRNGRRGGDVGLPWGAERARVGEKEAAGDGRGQNPGEWGETLGAASPPEWTPIPAEWNGGRGVARPPEWRKTPGGAATEWEGGQIVSGRLDLPRRGRGGRVFPGRLDPQWTGWGLISIIYLSFGIWYDRFQINMCTFYMRTLVLVQHTVVIWLYQTNYHSFSYWNTPRHNLVFELCCGAKFFWKIIVVV